MISPKPEPRARQVRKVKQYVLWESQADELESLAQEYGVSASAVLREVIKRGIPTYRNDMDTIRRMQAVREAI